MSDTFTRTIAGHAFTLKTKRMRTADLSSDTRYQMRLGDNPGIRARDIVRDFRTKGSICFTENVICVELDGQVLIVDGFGRVRSSAPDMLNLEEQDIDFLQGSRKEREAAAQLLSWCANLDHVAQKGNSSPELAIITYLQSEKGKIPYKELAKMHKCGLETIQRRVLKGKRYYEAKNKPRAIDEPEVFSGAPEAVGGAKKALAKVLKRTSNGETLEDIAGELKSKYNVDVFVLSGNNEKQIYHLFYVALENAQRGVCSNYLVLLYNTQANCSKAKEMPAARWVFNVKHLVAGYAPGACTFHCETLSKDEAFNVAQVRGYLADCQRRPYRRPVAFRAAFIAQVNQPACARSSGVARPGGGQLGNTGIGPQAPEDQDLTALRITPCLPNTERKRAGFGPT